MGKAQIKHEEKQIKGTILAGAIMMAAMSMTTNAMAADITPAVQSEHLQHRLQLRNLRLSQ